MPQCGSAGAKHKETGPSHKLEDMQARIRIVIEKPQNDKYNYFNMTQQTLIQSKLVMVTL